MLARLQNLKNQTVKYTAVSAPPRHLVEYKGNYFILNIQQTDEIAVYQEVEILHLKD